MAKSCVRCQTVKNSPAVAPLHPWLWPSCPWQRVHVDFAGPFKGKMFLILMDGHSKWPEVIEMSTTSSEKTIEAQYDSSLQDMGYWNSWYLITGPNLYTSQEFARFTKANGIKHIWTTPYPPFLSDKHDTHMDIYTNTLQC